MKSRYVFKIKEPMTTDELYAMMQKQWNTRRFNTPVKGMPEPKAYEEFVILPGTYQHVVIIYAEKKKIIMSSYWVKTDLAEQLAETVTFSSEFYPLVQESRGLPAGQDRMGPLKKIMHRYSLEMFRMLAEVSEQ